MTDGERARQLLESDSSRTCAFVKGEESFTRAERGVKPLLALLEERSLRGFSAADRVAGRAAAFLYVLLGVKEVYAEVMSASAVEVFRAHKIAYGYQNLTPYIVNRQGSGLCPMEEATEGISDPTEGLRAIREKLSLLRTQASSGENV